ncbi:arginase-like, partial [Trifolium medium]|nr:arginase-like [Trifolium medium]
GELARGLIGSAIATSTILGVPLGHNSSYAEGSAFAPPRIREAINWHRSTNSITEEGKNLKDPRVITDVGDVPIQDIRDCGVKDERLMKFVSDSVKIVMDQVYI